MIKKICVIGGGITGIISAISLAEKGHKVTLYEKNLLLQQTSSKTTKLIHGGIRYLENFQIKEVKNGLDDRFWWMQNYPNFAKYVEIVIPIQNIFEFVKYFLGIKIYEILAGKKKFIKGKVYFKRNLKEFNLSKKFSLGLSFFDGAMDDKDISIELIKLAKKLGIEIHENYEVKKIETDGFVENIKFDNVILCAGPWTQNILSSNDIESKKDIDYIKGSHLIINRSITRGFMIKADCMSRYIFALPYNKKMLVGTTEIRNDSPEPSKISEMEIKYLIKSINNYFKETISEDDIMDSYSGVRPLIKSNKENFHGSSRDYFIQKNNKLFSVFGGKWTTAPSIARDIDRMVSK